MAADANIFQEYLRAPKSVMDYRAEFDQADSRKNALAQAALATKTSQQAYDDDQSYRTAAAASGGDQNALVQALYAKGLAKQAQAIQAGGLANDKTKAVTSLANAHAGKFSQETQDAARMAHIKSAGMIQTPEDALAWSTEAVKNGILTPEQFQAGIQKIPSDPQGLQQWKGQVQQGGLTVLEQMHSNEPKPVETRLGNVVKYLDMNPRSSTFGKEVTPAQQIGQSADNAATNARTAADNAASRQVQMRGQNLTDARTRESNGKAPPGYIWGPAGADGNPTLIAAKGGPADLKMVGALNQDTQALTGSVNSMDRLASAANEVLNHPGLKGISGIRGSLPNMPGSDAADAQALLGTLKSQVGFGVLQDMRNNSKTGGALGSVSDAEGKRLESNLAALEKSQSLEQFKTNLAKIVKYSDEAKGRLREAYNLKHGYSSVQPSQPQGGAAAALPATNQQGWSLHTDAKGNQAYVSPDGKQFQEVK